MEVVAFVFSLAGISLGIMGFIFGSTAYSRVQALTKEVQSLHQAIKTLKES